MRGRFASHASTACTRMLSAQMRELVSGDPFKRWYGPSWGIDTYVYTLHTPPTAAHRCALVTAKDCVWRRTRKRCSDAHSSVVVGQMSINTPACSGHSIHSIKVVPQRAA